VTVVVIDDQLPPDFLRNALAHTPRLSFNITRDIRGEARLVERAFGLGVCALAEAMQFVSERLELEAA
jgi:transposase, IS6 family